MECFFQHKPILGKSFWDGGGHFLSGTGQKITPEDDFTKKWQKGKKRGKIEKYQAGWGIAQINHYAVRTESLYMKKVARGRIGVANKDAAPRYTSKYFKDLNQNTATDHSILRHEAVTSTELQNIIKMMGGENVFCDLVEPHYTSENVDLSSYKIMGIDASNGGKVTKPNELKGDIDKEVPQERKETVIIQNDATKLYEKMHKSHHEEVEQRKYANNILAKAIYSQLKPKTGIDIGCGIGLLMNSLINCGVKMLGVEGEWLTDDAMLCSAKNYMRKDLETGLSLADRYDVAITIEVAEHLEPESADSFVEDLCALSDVIVFSAAIPGQGGKGHKNEQWQSYWAQRFEAQGYKTYDPFRDAFRKDAKMLPWIQQNVLVFALEKAATHLKLKPHAITVEAADMILRTYHMKVLKRTRRRLRKRIEQLKSR